MTTLNDGFYLDKTIYSGRPSNPDGRMDKELRTYDFLDQLNIPYERVDHSPTDTVLACHDIDKILNIEICKNLFLRNAQKTTFYLLLMPGCKKFRTAVLSKQIGSSRLSFAEPEFMEQFLDITPGSVSILGLINDKQKSTRLLIDRDVIRHEFFGCHPCINTSSLKLRTSDLLTKFLPALDYSYTLVDLPNTEGTC
ncbi:prolyl-tRNA synthetase associated domain-containing protein [Clostridium sp. chh4-2]|uniref:prolyl-tRNA synthetase associated domain-containing protein n=1 Tax=Clostridium sp. chh4-2 TaxID=2067550 RepID=UPI000CCE1E71|nr:prolyl-tRNA synthetase associated domain-containing protein [Clostridium sp. chh4-2]PNV61578.1 prolyl-tRNA synthetase associated domain-containing protein [Clostridium sp. chh4-2]